MSSLDIVTSQSSFRSHLCVPVAHCLCPGGTQSKNFVRLFNSNRLELAWKHQFQSPQLRQRKMRVIMDRRRTVINAVAIVEPNILVQTDEMHKHALGSQLGQLLMTSEENDSKLDEPEKLRRRRISMANKGNVPWNKGRKHSPETIERIRERTLLAMQDPKVKQKLITLGLAQSQVIRSKIAFKARQRWQSRRETFMVQETCFLEWKNAIAEMSRVGYSGDEVLQWDSYEILEQQLMEEWKMGAAERRSMPRPRGNRRAPKSLEQRRKISEAIQAKWADPAYRERVYSGIAKFRGITMGVGGKSRKKKIADAQTSGRDNAKKKSKELNNIQFVTKPVKEEILKRKGPTYKDPLVRSKLKLLKQIRVQRVKTEKRKRKETKRAKLLIAEAEKATKALEPAALRSPIARDSLLEARKLIAEAIRTIESIEKGELPSEANLASLIPDSAGIQAIGPQIATHSGLQTTRGHTFQEEPHVNGSCQLPLIESIESHFQFDEITMQSALKENKLLFSGDPKIYFERVSDDLEQATLLLNDAGDRRGMLTTPCLVELDKASSSSVSEESGPPSSGSQPQHSQMYMGDKLDIQLKSTESNPSPAKTKKKWVHGRFVVVED